MIAQTPKPPYYAVIFTSTRTNVDEGYGATANRMMELASGYPGYLGVEHARDDVGITVSYWSDEASLIAWKADAEHQLAQNYGREKWYAAFCLRIAKVERDYGFTAP